MNYAILDKETGMVIGVEPEEWAKWLHNPLNKRIALDWIALHKVSTVFLGLNHAFDPNARPEWFETMVFGPEHEVNFFGRPHQSIGEELECWRSSSLEEALDTHAHAIEWLQNYLANK